ncbi:F-box protein containing LRR [Plasmopara halstedii]|uniref:F-box protein containing LRR n=1 Tax=Plasmopara halstedii TaxID=4781 RepID=A0A0P1B4H9_PLAHL|nr:F-box protein containing LRR [Plasmopara halstedii]CEG49216.1 F-box protein containing LRR [Plasmopara halstedii]|eukprot:XP_024585585.1 F-box protein containing LRR [Plasmopara halstedii]
MVESNQAIPSLAALCVARLANGASQRALLKILRRLPEELVQTLLSDMKIFKKLTDDRLAAFFMISRRVLNLSGCFSVRNSILRQIPFRCPELRCLNLSSCPQITNTVIRAVLQGCSNLQTLQLDGCRHITDAAFQPDHSPFYALHACTSLKVVSFARCSQLTKDLVLFLVKACRSLTDINFSRCKRINDDAIHLLLRSATDLQRVNLSFINISDKAFTTEPSDQRNGFYTKHCPHLEELKLSCCSEITDVGVEALMRSCTRLRRLDLTNCAWLTDRGVAMIGTYGHQLRRLNMSWCMNITDKSVVDIARGCNHLQEVVLVWCTQLTGATIDAFLPDDESTSDRSKGVKLNLCGCKGISRAHIDKARSKGLEIKFLIKFFPRGGLVDVFNRTMTLRRFDINVKGVEGIQERTIGGGVVTLLSCAFAIFLMLSEFSVWWSVDVIHHMHVDTEPQDLPINIEVDVSFLHENCQEVAMDVSDSKGRKAILISKNIEEEPYGENGCRLHGTVQVQKVAGELSFAHKGSLTVFSFLDFLNFNSSHVVNHLRFGPQIPDMETPLIDVSKILTMNLATYKYFVSIVPSRYVYLNGRSVTTFQYSVTEHETGSRGTNGQMSFPGVIFSTSAIVGGVFAVARMIDGAIYSISKKID